MALWWRASDDGWRANEVNLIRIPATLGIGTAILERTTVHVITTTFYLPTFVFYWNCTPRQTLGRMDVQGGNNGKCIGRFIILIHRNQYRVPLKIKKLGEIRPKFGRMITNFSCSNPFLRLVIFWSFSVRKPSFAALLKRRFLRQKTSFPNYQAIFWY